MSVSYRLLRQVLLTAITLLAAWLVMMTTIGSVFAKSQPAVALAWSPSNAEANGNQALQLFGAGLEHPPWPAITRAARAALARSVANVPAIAMLGAEADARGRITDADKLFGQSGRLSRHESVTQMYLIEASVRHGDITTALDHYDAALATLRANADILAPVLVEASANPMIARPLARLLSRRPVWWADFSRRLVAMRADPSASFPILFGALRLDTTNPDERAILSAAINRLVEAGHGSEGYILYRGAVKGAPARPAAVRDGDFEVQVLLPPFDWQLRDDDEASGSIQPLGSGNALFVTVSGESNVEVASQSLLLAPGHYVLSARIGSVEGESNETVLSIVCVGASTTKLGEVRSPRGAAAAIRQAALIVPAGCPVQRLSVLANSAEQTGGQSWVDEIAVRPTR